MRHSALIRLQTSTILPVTYGPRSRTLQMLLPYILSTWNRSSNVKQVFPCFAGHHDYLSPRGHHVTPGDRDKYLFTWSVNTLRPRQNWRHFADDIFKCIFVDENIKIPIKISLKFVPVGPINNIPALVQIMVGAVQATNHYLNQW